MYDLMYNPQFIKQNRENNRFPIIEEFEESTFEKRRSFSATLSLSFGGFAERIATTLTKNSVPKIKNPTVLVPKKILMIKLINSFLSIMNLVAKLRAKEINPKMNINGKVT